MFVLTGSPGRRLAKQCLLLLLPVLLGACSNLTPFGETQASANYSALQYYAWVANAGEDELASEHMRLTVAENASLSAVSTVQLAMLLSVPKNSSARSLQQARATLAPLLKDSQVSQSDYGLFASMWDAVLAEREGGSKVQQTTDSEISGLTRKILQLEQQIEALTSIEQQLKQREQLQGQP